jgi:hypothetical protein
VGLQCCRTRPARGAIAGWRPQTRGRKLGIHQRWGTERSISFALAGVRSHPWARSCGIDEREAPEARAQDCLLLYERSCSDWRTSSAMTRRLGRAGGQLPVPRGHPERPSRFEAGERGLVRLDLGRRPRLVVGRLEILTGKNGMLGRGQCLGLVVGSQVSVVVDRSSLPRA